jgi:hypothetical protein
MRHISPKKILMIGLILMSTGVALPFLMVIHILDSTVISNFIAFGSQVIGLFLGTAGVLFYVGLRKR